MHGRIKRFFGQTEEGEEPQDDFLEMDAEEDSNSDLSDQGEDTGDDQMLYWEVCAILDWIPSSHGLACFLLITSTSGSTSELL
jgi:hypothetical protein